MFSLKRVKCFSRALGARMALLEAELAHLGAVRKNLLALADLERAIGRELR